MTKASKSSPGIPSRIPARLYLICGQLALLRNDCRSRFTLSRWGRYQRRELEANLREYCQEHGWNYKAIRNSYLCR